MKLAVFLILTILSFSCATSTTHSNSLTPFNIQNLKYGQSNKVEIENLLGKPKEVLTKLKDHEIWIYNESISVTFNSNGILIGAIWTPSLNSENLFLSSALEQFKLSKFKIQNVGWDKLGHYYSDDIRYIDEENSISFTVHPKNQSVLNISFSVPKKRIPAQSKEKI